MTNKEREKRIDVNERSNLTFSSHRTAGEKESHRREEKFKEIIKFVTKKCNIFCSTKTSKAHR